MTTFVATPSTRQTAAPNPTTCLTPPWKPPPLVAAAEKPPRKQRATTSSSCDCIPAHTLPFTVAASPRCATSCPSSLSPPHTDDDCARHPTRQVGYKDEAVTPTRALILRLKKARLERQRAAVHRALEVLEAFTSEHSLLAQPFEPSFAVRALAGSVAAA